MNDASKSLILKLFCYSKVVLWNLHDELSVNEDDDDCFSADARQLRLYPQLSFRRTQSRLRLGQELNAGFLRRRETPAAAPRRYRRGRRNT